jgi:hypothetical protein
MTMNSYVYLFKHWENVVLGGMLPVVSDCILASALVCRRVIVYILGV